MLCITHSSLVAYRPIDFISKHEFTRLNNTKTVKLVIRVVEIINYEYEMHIIPSL